MDNLHFHFISHTHWDREWYLNFQQYRWRYIKMMDLLIDLMKTNPEYKFFTMDGQVLIIGDYLEVRPEREEDLKKLVGEGRIRLGPWYSQPNFFMVSGESLVRNLLYGYRESRKYGDVMKVCYSPDAFGFPSQLPQIMDGFGIEDIVMWRGMPRGSKTVFRWKGVDGTESYGWYMFGGYGNARGLQNSVEDVTQIIDSTPIKRDGLKTWLNKVVEKFSPKMQIPFILMMNGIDHQFPQSDLPEILQKIKQLRPDYKIEHSTFQKCFDTVKEYIGKNKIELETASGELRDHSEGLILPGSQSTRADVKMMNNRIEGLFEKWMEPFASISWMAGASYPGAEMYKAWEFLLQNHSHDSLACSSTDHTYHQVIARFEWAEELGEEIVHDSLQLLCNAAAGAAGGAATDNVPAADGPSPTADDLTVLIFNPLGWSRSEVLTTIFDVPQTLGMEHLRLMDGDREVRLEVLKKWQTLDLKFNPKQGISDWIPVDRFLVTVAAEDIPALGFKRYTLQKRAVKKWYKKELITAANSVENEYIKLTVNSNGTFDLLDKQTNTLYSSLGYFEDCGEAGDGFQHIAPMNDTVANSLGSSAKIKCITESSLKVVFQIDLDFFIPESLTPDKIERTEETVPCHITTLLTVTEGSPRVDIETTVNNKAKDHRLRTAFPSNIRSDKSFAEQPFDVVERNIPLPDFNDYEIYDGHYVASEKPSPTRPQLSFVDITDGEKGLMVANQGLYEYEVMEKDSRDIAVTLLRCTDVLHFGAFEKCEGLRLPEMQCIGDYTFRYSVIPHRKGWLEGYKQAYSFKYPMKAVLKKTLEDSLLPDFDPSVISYPFERSYSLLQFENGGDDVIVSAVKKHETRDSLIVRLLNPENTEKKTSIKINPLSFKVAAVYRTDLQEERLSEIHPNKNGYVDLSLRGKEIATLEFAF